jgi:single-strand DNA-binding protein
MAYDLTGKIKVIQAAQTFGAKGFTKRAFVVTVADGKYPQDIALECVQDKVNLLDGLNVGQTVTVSFDIRGREYNGRYFNNLQALRISAGEGIKTATDDEHPPIPADFEDTTDYGATVPF